jgi:hypothetical protein
MLQHKANFENFNDGSATFVITENRKLKKNRCILAFGERVVGVTRYYQARIANSTVSKLICIPYYSDIVQSDVVIIDSTQYKISQIQYKPDKRPKCLYISLESLNPKYGDARE